MIKAEKLTFGFTSTPLFQNISFSLEENCHCAMIGSNGTGKTTLMNLIREPGSFLFDGKLTLDGAGRIGYVSQFAIREGDQSMTVYDYLCRDFLELEQAIGDVCMEMEDAADGIHSDFHRGLFGGLGGDLRHHQKKNGKAQRHAPAAAGK